MEDLWCGQIYNSPEHIGKRFKFSFLLCKLFSSRERERERQGSKDTALAPAVNSDAALLCSLRTTSSRACIATLTEICGPHRFMVM